MQSKERMHGFRRPDDYCCAFGPAALTSAGASNFSKLAEVLKETGNPPVPGVGVGKGRPVVVKTPVGVLFANVLNKPTLVVVAGV